jgi:hypothetical protein
MSTTARSWKEMMEIQRANALANGNTARLARINAALTANGVAVAPAPAPAPLAGPGINLSNFSANNLKQLNAVAKSMRPKQSELEQSYGALNAAEKLAKTTKKKRTRRRATRRNKRT